MAGRTREILFKIFYSSSFTFVFLLLIAFCGVAPADKLYESWSRRRIVDIIIIAAAWVLTALIAAFLYCTRLYTTRSILRDIPKTFLPIEREDLPGRNTYRLIQETYARTAVIAYQAKPRGRRIEKEVDGAGERMLALSGQMKVHHHHHTLTKEEEALLKPKWGEIKHPGWQSPASEEMPGLEYAQVADELVDLIEAKAGVGMRTYLSRLAELAVLPDDELVEDFLLVYEHSRYSGKPMTETDFQTMMRLFAEILRGMRKPSVDDLVDLESDLDDDDDSGSVRKQSKKGKGSAESRVNGIVQPALNKSSSTLSFGSNNSVIHNPVPDELAFNAALWPNAATQPLPAPSREPTHTRADSDAINEPRASAAVSYRKYTQHYRERPRQLLLRSKPTELDAQSQKQCIGKKSGKRDQAREADAGNRDVGSGTGLPYEINVRGFGTR
ncbi:uncharacterized protein AB675_7028 [Cyphellophora attinorum]|uniref:Defect at low temperature protein 1 n=1 Tax=Cyphellophora attinorum TaxID=1664694 RepID=A0A0N0NQ79_9EURO|nr:uncharacterized protein AB675_7028 [Phialophora attinorum]KPI43389.1 hypothetical protein AB675_7028 [Phialophora attinorum]